MSYTNSVERFNGADYFKTEILATQRNQRKIAA